MLNADLGYRFDQYKRAEAINQRIGKAVIDVTKAVNGFPVREDRLVTSRGIVVDALREVATILDPDKTQRRQPSPLWDIAEDMGRRAGQNGITPEEYAAQLRTTAGHLSGSDQLLTPTIGRDIFPLLESADRVATRRMNALIPRGR